MSDMWTGKYRTRLVTESGSTYIWSPMYDTFRKVGEDPATSPYVYRQVHIERPFQVGDRAVVLGERWHPGRQRWQSGDISTSRVVSITYEPDPGWWLEKEV